MRSASRADAAPIASVSIDPRHRRLGIALGRVLAADLRRNPPVAPARKRRPKSAIALVKGGAR